MKLIIVSTPIGNLDDISIRGLQALGNVDYILCEDTRRTQKLKARFSLKPKLVSFHEHNEKKRIPKILSLMQRGKTFALVSDAGSPLLSDPGKYLIREMIQARIPFTYVPGPSAVIAALILSGLPVYPFCFYGFLPVKRGEREAAFSKLQMLHDQTLVFFESPKRVLGLLREIGEKLGDREVAVCRELTKKYEEILRGRVSELISRLSSRRLQGEFTIVVGPSKAEVDTTMNEENILTRFQQLKKEGLSRKDALKQVSKESGRQRNELYKMLIKKK